MPKDRVRFQRPTAHRADQTQPALLWLQCTGHAGSTQTDCLYCHHKKHTVLTIQIHTCIVFFSGPAKMSLVTGRCQFSWVWKIFKNSKTRITHPLNFLTQRFSNFFWSQGNLFSEETYPRSSNQKRRKGEREGKKESNCLTWIYIRLESLTPSSQRVTFQ